MKHIKIYLISVVEYIKKTEIVDKDWLDNFTEQHSSVFQDFKNNRKKLKNLNPVHVYVSEDETSLDTSNYLIDKLNNIKTGNASATEYHHLMAVI